MDVHNTPAISRRTVNDRLEKGIREIKKESGKPVIGYLCCFAPPEIIAAAGAIPFRITGRPNDDNSPADAYVEPYGCTYVRNILSRAIKGEFDFLDGLVISHSCDMVQRLYGIWTYYHPLPYSYLFNVPHQLTPWAQRFYYRELGFFKESVEKFTGRNVTPAKLGSAIELYNQNRKLIRRLYRARQDQSPSIQGSEILELLLAGGGLPAEDFNVLLKKTIASLKQKQDESDKSPRIMVWGSIIDNPRLYRMIESAGATVVADDTCIGSRVWENDVPVNEDLYKGLAEHYFVNFQCPRTDRGPGLQRYDYILKKARAYEVDGIIAYTISFCDPHKFEYPDLRDYLKAEGLSMLLVDDNYSFEPAGALETRLQAFIEML